MKNFILGCLALLISLLGLWIIFIPPLSQWLGKFLEAWGYFGYIPLLLLGLPFMVAGFWLLILVIREGGTFKYASYAIIKTIPKGRVATYGQIARLAGILNGARQVGYALNALPEGLNIPWQRVINAKGEISARAETFFENEQRKLLEREGIVFNMRGQISLKRFQWKPSRKAS